MAISLVYFDNVLLVLLAIIDQFILMILVRCHVTAGFLHVAGVIMSVKPLSILLVLLCEGTVPLLAQEPPGCQRTNCELKLSQGSIKGSITLLLVNNHDCELLSN